MFLFQAMSKISRHNNPKANYGLFIGGYTSSPSAMVLGDSSKYFYDTDIVSAGSSLITPRYGLTTISDGNYSVCNQGATITGLVTATDKYVFSSDVISQQTNLTMSRACSAGASTSTFGLFIGGSNSTGVAINTIENYNFATGTISTGNALGFVSRLVVAAGNNQQCIVGPRYNVYPDLDKSTEKHIYSTNTVVPGTALSGILLGTSANGNTTKAIFAGGATNTVNTDGAQSNILNEYIYATDVVVGFGSLQIPVQIPSATGNNFIGLVSYGWSYGTFINNTSKIIYPNYSTNVGTALGTPRYQAGATSSSPGGQ